MCPQKGETRPEETKENVAEVTKKKIAEESFLSRYLCWGNQRCQKRIFHLFQTILRPKFFAEENKFSQPLPVLRKLEGSKAHLLRKLLFVLDNFKS